MLNKQKQDENSVSQPSRPLPSIGTVKLKLDKFILNSVTVKVAYNCCPFGHQQLAVCKFRQNQKYQNLSWVNWEGLNSARFSFNIKGYQLSTSWPRDTLRTVVNISYFDHTTQLWQKQNISASVLHLSQIFTALNIWFKPKTKEI